MGSRRIVPASASGRAATALAATLSVATGLILAVTGTGPLSAQEPDPAAIGEAAALSVVRPAAATSDNAKAVHPSDIRLTDYDPGAKRATLAWSGRSGTRKSTVKAGDVIASAPTAHAPNGALFKVRTATATDAGTEVSTEPATLSDALGHTTVSRTIEASALEMTVKPLAAGVRPVVSIPATPQPAGATGEAPSTTGPRQPTTAAPPSAAAEPASGPTTAAPAPAPAGRTGLVQGLPARVGEAITPSRTPDGGLLLALDIPLDGVGGISGTGAKPAKLTGWVGLTPKLLFSFGKKRVDGANPFQAEIGVGGRYQYGWHVDAKLSGRVDTGEKDLRIPFAEVRLRETLWIGPVPIVLSVDLKYFYRLTAEGTLTIDSEQSTTGEFALGARYDSRTGWGPLNRNDATTTRAKDDLVTGRGDFRATIGADLTVMLYDSVGVSGRLAPYVRATVDATRPPKVLWGIYAGFDLTGALKLDLRIFGITVLKKDLPFPPLHAEWKVATSTPPPLDRPTPAQGQPPGTGAP